jgi:hypothetical protein
MRTISLTIPLGVTDSLTPNDAAFPSARVFDVPATLESTDVAPRALLGALRGAAAMTATVWAQLGNGTSWAVLGTLTIAAEAAFQPVVPNTAGAPTALPGKMAIRITAAAATAATLDLAPAP